MSHSTFDATLTANVTRFDLVEIMRLLWRRKWLLLIVSLVGALLGAAISMGLAPRYQAEGNLVVRSDALTEPDTDKAFYSMAVNEAVVNTEQEILTSKGLLKRVAEQVDIPSELLPSLSLLQGLREWLDSTALISQGWKDSVDRIIQPVQSSPEAVLERRTRFITRALSIVTTKGSSVISVRAVTLDANLSATIVNSVMHLYMQDRSDEESRTAQVIENALRERLRQTRQQIDQGETQLVKLFHQKGTIENTEIPGQWQRMTLIGKELVTAQAQLARMKAAYGRGDDLARAQALVNTLQQEMNQERQAREEQSTAQIAVNGQRDAVASLWRVNDALEARLIDLAAHPTSLNARILSPASTPLRPSFPSTFLFTIGGFVAASIAAVMSLLMATHVRGRRPMAVQFARMMNAPLLGGLPHVYGLRARRPQMLTSATGGRTPGGPADTLYAVALELDDAVKAGKLRSVTVTSGYSGEGKTTVASALGRSLASMSLRVLLIDLDLRRPSAERMFLSTSPDSLEPQTQRIGPQHVLEVRVDRQSGLHIMTPFPSGCDDPLGYLRSSSLRETVELAGECYDLLIFDTPPVMSLPDALVVTRLSDAIVLVAELGRSNEIAGELLRRLASTRRTICGVVVNKVAASDTLSGTYSGYDWKTSLRIAPGQ